MRAHRLAALIAVLAGTVAGPRAHARADAVDEIGKRLLLLDGEALELEKQLEASVGAKNAGDTAERRLVEAQVAYGLGNYADATILLYGVVESYPQSRAYPEALFYLADSLFQKGDNLTARDYFHKILSERGERDPRYQEALERLIELSLRLQDPSGIQDYLARLDRLPKGSQLPSVPYVRGKYAYFTGAHDQAVQLFDGIGRDSKYYFQARYFVGVSQVARGDLTAAEKVFHDLVNVKPQSPQEEKILELGHLALGRIHYERDQPTDAIDHYLMIGRTSPYFDEALYEVAWVYVKAKEFDKALRALELLSLANPKSATLPDVRILEGNLRIRKAQAIAASQGNSSEEYGKATQVFETTRTSYEKPKADLDRVMAKHADPKQFFAQLTGRAGTALDVQVELPEIALEWVKQEPEVGRVMGITKSLDEIREELDDTGKILERLDKAVSSPSRVTIFPELAARRSRAQNIGETVASLQQQLTTHERVLTQRVQKPEEQAELAAAQKTRRELAARLAALPGSSDSLEERIHKARDQWTDLDKKAQEVEVQIIGLQAELVAVEKYYHDTQGTQKLTPADYERAVGEVKGLIEGLTVQLDAIRQDAAGASDEAGISDEMAREETAVRERLAEAVRSEHAFLQRLAARLTPPDRRKVEQIAAIMVRSSQVEQTLRRVNGKIDKILDAQLDDVKKILVEEKGHLAEYRHSLKEYEAENLDVGSTVVAGSFDKVSKKFYEITVRADVGLLDVAWAQKEGSQKTVDRLRLDYAHEKNTLDGEFRDVREEAEPGESQAKPAEAPPAAPASQPAQRKREEGSGVRR
jgi:tetratricopeptide (TPR) repeat protein